MKKIFKNILLTSIIGAGIASCSGDFLEETRKGSWHQDNFQDTTNIATDVIAEARILEGYAHLRSWGVHVFPFIGLTSVTSDDADKGSAPADAPVMKELDVYSFNTAHPFVSDYYASNFQGVYFANNALDLIATVKDEEIQKVLEADARFLRAFYYFRLTQAFGGVPIVDKVLEQDEAAPARATLEDTWSFIEDDLLFAIENLPTKTVRLSEGGLGRSTVGAARGLLAKAYLYQKRYDDVLAQTNAIINSGEYDLSTPYHQIFTEAKENGPESLFEVQAENLLDASAPTAYAQVQGVRGAANLGWGFNVPSEALVNAYEAGDPRKEATVIFADSEVEPGVIIPPMPETVNPYYNMKVYPWKDEMAVKVTNPKGGWINIRVLRYADVILMHAEAANELGQSSEALAKLEMVRARARGNNAGVLPEVTTADQSELRSKIQHERRVEFGMEHERYFDLIRWGLAETVLGPLGWQAGKHELFPIPQIEIDRSNGVLTQNPGY